MSETLASRFRSNPLVIVLSMFSLGIIIDRVAPQSVLAWLIPLLLGLAAGRCSRGRRLSIWLAVAVVCLGGLRHHTYWHLYAPDDLSRFAGQLPRPVQVCVRALGKPKIVPAPPSSPLLTTSRGDVSRVEVSALTLGQAGHEVVVSGRGLLHVAGHLLHVDVGDRLRITGQLVKPAGAMNPGQFDVARYERAQRRTYRLLCSSPDCVLVVEKGRPGLRRWVEQLRTAAKQQLWHNLSRQRYELGAAILLGAREQLSRDRAKSFFETGTIHLLAVSGLHVGILASGLLWLARTSVVPPRCSYLLVISLTVAYALVAEARAPVIRATILVCVACLGWMLRRQASSANSIAAAALIVLMINPTELFQPGAQLSFVAVATLARIARTSRSATPEDPLDRLLHATRTWPVRALQTTCSWVSSALAASAIVWSVTLPLVMFHFHIVCPVAIVLNVLLWIPISCVLLFGFAAIAIGWLVPGLGPLLGMCCDWQLGILETVVEIARLIPGTRCWCAGQEAVWVVFFYALWAGYCVCTPTSRRRWIIVVLSLVSGWLLPRGQLENWTQPQGSVRCSFLSVGHGTCVVLELPDKQCLVYDAGSLASHEHGVDIISGFLWSRGIWRVRRLILSHADADHFNAVPGLLERFRVDEMLVATTFFDQSSEAIEYLRSSVREAGVPLRGIAAGVEVSNSEAATITVLHPGVRRVGKSDNENSVVLSIELKCDDEAVLLPGDIEGAGLALLMRRPAKSFAVVMAPHHGSLRGEPLQFLGWSKPAVVVISGRLAPAAPRQLRCFGSSGARVFHTAMHGAVTIVWAPGSTRQVKCYRHSPIAVMR